MRTEPKGRKCVGRKRMRSCKKKLQEGEEGEMETKKEPSAFTISWAKKGAGSVLAVELNMPPPKWGTGGRRSKRQWMRERAVNRRKIGNLCLAEHCPKSFVVHFQETCLKERSSCALLLCQNEPKSMGCFAIAFCLLPEGFNVQDPGTTLASTSLISLRLSPPSHSLRRFYKGSRKRVGLVKWAKSESRRGILGF